MKIRNLLIIIGSTGIGKTTLQNELIDKFQFYRLVTTTTRKPRKDEKHGVDYYFENEDKFLSSQDQYLFQDQIFNNWYGISHEEIKRAANTNRPVVSVVKINKLEVFESFCENIVIVELIANDVSRLIEKRKSASDRMLNRLEISEQEKNENERQKKLSFSIIVDELDEQDVFYLVSDELKRRKFI